MFKVLKTSIVEFSADVEEFFDGETIEEATKKAHYQSMPGELAKINITDCKVVKEAIKIVGKEQHGSKKSSGTESTATGGEQKNV